jgi:3-hydroxy-9,10-secoandrosta-1,3,5(10)-triene-9,17-dione monooxygenase
LPRLRDRAEKAEELRRVPDDTIDDFREAGLFRVFQPARYGGYELDYGATQLALAGVLGRGCGSSAWMQSVVACHAWIVGMYPEAVQDAVWGSNPEALIASSFATSTGKGARSRTATSSPASGSSPAAWMRVTGPS